MPATPRNSDPFTVVRQLFIADKPIGPVVGYFDFDTVFAWLQCPSNVDAKGRFPQDAEINAIDPNPRHVFDCSKIDIGFITLGNHVLGNVDVSSIRAGAGEVTNARIGMIGQ